MNIENHFNNVKEWAESREILLVEADFDEKKAPVVDVSGSGKESLSLFLKIVEKLKAEIIVCEVLRFDKAAFNENESIINKMDADDQVREMFERMRHYEGTILGYALTVFKDGVTFRLSEYSEESDDFLEVEQVVLDHEDEEENDSPYKTLPLEKIAELGRLLAEHENYAKLKNRLQRLNFSREFFKREFERFGVADSYDANMIVNHAESYYETTIKPQKEKELKAQIAELINKGWTKVKIAAHLGISKDTLNKYV